MKLDHDCIRDVLLSVERLQRFEYRTGTGNFLNYSVTRNILENDLQNRNAEDICYSVLMLADAGYIIASINHTDQRVVSYSVHRLTYDGHEYLESIRDGNVWNKVKSVIGDVGISTFDAVKKTAISLLLSKVQDIL